jgi:hypothetical protein
MFLRYKILIVRLFLRVSVFFQALYWHISRGMPKSTQEQIDYRYNICSLCDKFDRNNQSCQECGCYISNKKRFLNKLAWSDQNCPLDKWNSFD